MGIIEGKKLPIVCTLGGFHTLVSFLGSVSTLMKGSGIQILFAEVYAENSTGLRAHMLAESALMVLLLDLVYEESELDFKVLEPFYQMAVAGELDCESFSELISSEEFLLISQKLLTVKTKLREKSRTG